MNPAPEVCPVCGHDVPANARACPECGADPDTGWGGDEMTGGINLPDDEFDYERFVEREFGSGARPQGVKRIWWITGLVLIAALVFVFVF